MKTIEFTVRFTATVEDDVAKQIQENEKKKPLHDNGLYVDLPLSKVIVWEGMPINREPTKLAVKMVEYETLAAEILE